MVVGRRPSRHVGRGRVEAIHRWPVKSFAGGDTLERTAVGAHGLAGDRAHAAVDPRDPRGRALSGRRAPGLLRWSAAYAVAPDALLDAEDPPLPAVTSPEGTSFRWDEPELAAALAEHLRKPVELHRRPRGMPDRRGTVLLTTEATRAAVEAALGRPLDLRRFRTNLHLDLEAPAFAEEAWAGRRIEVGELALRVTEPCERCAIPTREPGTGERWPELLRWLFRERAGLFGVLARVERPAIVAVGEPAEA